MNRRTTVAAVAAVALIGFGIAGYFYTNGPKDEPVAPPQESSTLVRPHSPVLGPADAPVTIVEFFDPSCEACRAFYPIVKEIMEQYPTDVRVVLRYAPFHDGSDEAIRILETARMQNLFVPVLEALLAQQPEWAPHDGPQLDKAWVVAGVAGLDIAKAKAEKLAPHIMATLNLDVADGKSVGVSGTPTFFVNGKPLPNFGTDDLKKLVDDEVAAVR